ncbi:WD repeat-containing protein 90 isoform X1 [Monodelphis domestica]|uniref:WD repeat-containing protein 90 isoform X1 n=3 Tax=Monodelphis domestica TaxID=13616 RepID=UPI000443608C|nr:WD repeat-containing protein 90 isoform X1 [Monodelphis domestica]
MARVWQHPFLNVFKHLKVEEWKRSTKEGDVTTIMDKTLKGTVYRIRGAIPAGNFIQLPKTSTQSLGLTGRYLYLLFRPIPMKYFVVHLDVTTEDSQVIRISFSNLFKEFKSTSTWLQFPFIYEETTRPLKTSKTDLIGAAPNSVRWTCLQLDLQFILMLYLNRLYSHVKSIKLCANMLVKNIYTSDLSFDPGVTVSQVRQAKLALNAMPREMAFPVPKGEKWHDRYVFIRFPTDDFQMPSDPIQKSSLSHTSGPQESIQQLPQPVTVSKAIQDRVLLNQQITSPMARSHQAPSGQKSIPEVNLTSGHLETSYLRGQKGCRKGVLAGGDATVTCAANDSGIDVYVHKLGKEPTILEDPGLGEISSPRLTKSVTISAKSSSQHRCLLPDPILKLKAVIGFGGCSTKWALWSKDSSYLVYPCHAVIVALIIETGKQRFFIGHTDKVSSLAFNGNSTLLASSQMGPLSMVRLWNFETGKCLSIFKTHIHSICFLSFSYSGAILCGVGKDRHGKTMVVVWNTASISHGGEVTVLAKAHTDVDIQALKIAFFDDTRMVSCGRDNIRLWRIRGGTLRSCPVNLGEYHALEFTDLAFEEGHVANREPEERTLFVCSRSGHILEINYKNVTIQNARRLLPSQTQLMQRKEKTFNSGPGIAINSISISSTFCAMGSEDGYLRLWPLDFSSVFLEAEHEGAVKSVCISPDGLRVLSTTSTGNLGFLEIQSRRYNTLVRSHADLILAFAIEGHRKQLATVSQDNTIRIWDLVTMQQLYDFTTTEETPCAVTFHPTQQIFVCGFSNGIVRSFSLVESDLLVEYKRHRGAITGLAVSPDGNFMYSSCSQGTLALYNCSSKKYYVLRVLSNVVCQDSELGSNILAVNGNSCLLAFVGPSKYTVTIMDASSLDELLRIDISILDLESTNLDSALDICFAPVSSGHLLVSTSSNKVLVLDVKTGCLNRQLSNVHQVACSALALSEDAQFLLTAGDRAIKVWDFQMKFRTSFQAFIGHSEPVQGVAFTPDQQQIISIGDAIFIWDFLASPEKTSKASVHWSIESSPSLDTGPKIEKTRDAASITNGIPRQLIPMPSLASPPHLDISAMPPGKKHDVFSESDDEGTCLKDHILRMTQKTSDPYIEKKVDENTSGPGKTKLDTGNGKIVEPQNNVRPDSYRHFIARYKVSTLPKKISFPKNNHKHLRLKAVVGYNGNGRGNMVWRPDTGFFAYTCGCVVVVEDLHSGYQQHWLGHPEEISTLAVRHDARILASASGRGDENSRCQIRIWDVPGGTCQKVLFHHETEVQAMAYSHNDHLFISLGDYSDRTIALWNAITYELMSSTRFMEPVHDVAFNPFSANELACAGQGAITFWLMKQRGADINLQVHRIPVPNEIGPVELTSICYSVVPLLYSGTNTGQVCVWDIRTSRCFMTWEADEGEIGVLLCSGNRLISGSNTKRIRLWAVGAVQELRLKGSGARSSSVFMEQEMVLDGAVVSASFDDCMDMGIVGTTAGTLWYINWAEKTNIRLISGHKNKVNEVTFSPNESHCATCGEDGSVRVWSLTSMELVVQFQVLNQSCLCLAWSPSSSGRTDHQRVVAGYSDGTIRIFSISQTEMELKIHPHPVPVTAISFSVDGQTIISGDKDGIVAVSSSRTGITIQVLKDHQGSPITVIQSKSKEYYNFGLEGGELWLAVSADQRVSIWASEWLRDKCELVDWLSFPAPTSPKTPTNLPPSLAAFCPWNSNMLVYVGFGLKEEVLFYNFHQKQVVEKIPLSYFSTSLGVSPGSPLIAIGYCERLLRLIDCMSKTEQDFVGHNDTVHLCRFTPSGKLLFTAAYNEILVWEVLGPEAAASRKAKDIPLRPQIAR